MSDHAFCRVDAEIVAVIDAAARSLAAAGAIVATPALPVDFEQAFKTVFEPLLAAELAGTQCSEAYGEVLRLEKKRLALQAQWAAFFDAHDVLLCPAAPCVALRHDHRDFGERSVDINGESVPYEGRITCRIRIQGQRSV